MSSFIFVILVNLSQLSSWQTPDTHPSSITLHFGSMMSSEFPSSSILVRIQRSPVARYSSGLLSPPQCYCLSKFLSFPEKRVSFLCFVRAWYCTPFCLPQVGYMHGKFTSTYNVRGIDATVQVWHLPVLFKTLKAIYFWLAPKKRCIWSCVPLCPAVQRKRVKP